MFLYSEKAVCATLNIYEANKGRGLHLCNVGLLLVQWEPQALCSLHFSHWNVSLYINRLLLLFLFSWKRKKEVSFLPLTGKKNWVFLFGLANLLLQWIACNFIQCKSKSSNILAFSSDINNIKGSRSLNRLYFYSEKFVLIKLVLNSSVCHNWNSDLEIRQNDHDFDFNRKLFKIK